MRTQDFDPRDLKIKELERQIKEFKEREKIIQAIRKAQESILKESKILIIKHIFYSRFYSSLMRKVSKFYGKYLCQTIIGKFYRKFKNLFNKDPI